VKLATLAALCGLLAAGCEPVPATENTPTGGSPMPTSIVEPYLKIESALAHDSMEGVRQNAGDLATAATALGAPAFRIDSYAAVMASAMELDDARDKFGRLSAVIVTYMDGLHLVPPEGVRIAFCPTNQKPWLQEGPALDNPYYGSVAPACGAFR
jgi:hypothetical protein